MFGLTRVVGRRRWRRQFDAATAENHRRLPARELGCHDDLLNEFV